MSVVIEDLRSIWSEEPLPITNEPVSEATVTFTPQEGTEGAQIAVGITDAKGNYSLTMMQGRHGRGTAQGEYLVAISKRGGPPITMTVGGVRHVTEGFLVPMRYAYPDQSGLTATVAARTNQIDFDLTD